MAYRTTLTTCILAMLAQYALANPTGHEVAAGSASVSASGKTLTITNTPGTILNWQSFSIAPGELTKFVQQSAASAVLNRVVAANPSSILGTLQSNGRVFLVNPHGIVVGAGALIDTAGFVASTLNIADKDFLAGRMKFEGGGAGVLRNEGTIRAARDIFLVGPQIENTGIIRSDSGDVLLAAGRSITITSPDSHGVQFAIQAPEDSVLNLGSIQASNAVGLFAGTLKHSGEIKVVSASLDGAGGVVLSAQRDITIENGTFAPDGVNLTVTAPVINIGGNASVSTGGGTITAPDNVSIVIGDAGASGGVLPSIVIAGSANIQNNGSNTAGAITWNSFAIAPGEAAHFVSSTGIAVLNRVVGPNPVTILGQLQSNGTVSSAVTLTTANAPGSSGTTLIVTGASAAGSTTTSGATEGSRQDNKQPANASPQSSLQTAGVAAAPTTQQPPPPAPNALRVIEADRQLLHADALRDLGYRLWPQHAAAPAGAAGQGGGGGSE